MVKISEELVRKRAEHNDCEIFSLEELSLHQQDVEKIEHLERWCRDLKILYLQNNLIAKIENVGRLKKLEYLNLALNNIERIENLQACESLKKLDLTVNFVGELTSIESLRNNFFLKDLYLTGNPCTQYEGYKEYVIATLPQLKWLDGSEIEKSERIKATQMLESVRIRIIEQQAEYAVKRTRQKAEAEESAANEGTGDNTANKDGDESDDKKKDDEFWSEKVDYTPETRTSIQNKLQENREKANESRFSESVKEKRQRRLFNEEGKPMNVNEAKIDFHLTESDDDTALILDVSCWKHLDTSLIDADVQPWYVRVTLKGAILQLALLDEVKPDSSSAQRSQTTGHLIITMPKLYPPSVPARRPDSDSKATSKKNDTDPATRDHERLREKKREVLEVKEARSFADEIANISRDQKVKHVTSNNRKKKPEPENSPDFVDDPDVPPLI